MEKQITLPEIRKIKKLPLAFPTDWQAVIFRNYGMVTADKIAKVLNTDESVIISQAENLGLSDIKYNEDWINKGYITIIKNNWHLLSYRQILELLDMSESKLAFLLKEDDFLDVKLGNFKPYAEEPKYYPLSNSQKEETKKIKEIVKSHYLKYDKQPFDFFNKEDKVVKADSDETQSRIIYSYFALYGDSLMSENCESYPDYLLKKYASLNINGIWMQGLLYQLSEYPFDKNLSNGYKTRQKNLNKLIDRCKKYGIKVYLYLNEPRAMPEEFFKDKENLKGAQSESLYSLCTSKKEVKDYLYNSAKDLFTACPDLGGVITITMSENLTHCYSREFDGKCLCPICKERNAEEVAAEINNIFQKAAQDSNSNTRIIANLWGWDEFMKWDIEKTKWGIALLNKKINVMLISENSMKINIGGVESKIIDYSISNVGPSERSSKLLQYAKDKGHKIFAKVQINNSWECSAVPYIPVFDLIKEHMERLNELKVDGLMLSWTLGGYPGGGLSYISSLFNNNFNEKEWYKSIYGKNSKTVRAAVNIFSQAFKNFPFTLDFLYNGPQNLGSANLWYAENTGLNSTMVGFPYDDTEGWKGVYSTEIIVNQLKKLSEEWEKGKDLLNTITDSDKNTAELKTIANTCYAHFNSSYLICKYTQLREQYNKTNDKNTAAEIINILDKEQQNALSLYKAQSQNPCIGFEASNHYYYNENMLLEKLVNIENLKVYYLKCH